MRRALLLPLLALLLLSTALTGCTAGGGDTSSSGTASSAAANAASDGVSGAAATGEQAGLQAGGAAVAPGRAPDAAPVLVDALSRSVVRTAELTVRAADVPAATERAGAVARAVGGLVFGSTSDRDSGTASLTLKVPTDRLDGVLADLARLGTEVDRRVESTDVTGTVADVESRLANQRASVERVRGLLARAATVGEVVTVEAELVRREAELESLQARSRVLADSAALATVTLRLLTPGAALPADRDDQLGFLGGLAAGWEAFLRGAVLALTVLGAVLPFAVPVGLAGLVWLRLRRRARRPAAREV